MAGTITNQLENNRLVLKYSFIKDIAALNFVEKIILYGSRARGDQSARSDIDLAIECRQATDLDWLAILELIDKADTLLSIDCVRLDNLSKTDQLKHNILTQGRVIYDRDNGGFMSKEYWQDSFEALGKAIQRLREGFEKTASATQDAVIYRDATIQRFEFTAELFWKILKKFLSYEQIQANTPRTVLRESYKAGIIDEEEIWLKMMSDRNLTSHTYNEALADEIMKRIGIYLPVLEKTYQKLNERYNEM